VKLIRWILGRIILVIEWIMAPRGVGRSHEAQRVLDEATQGMTLYQLHTCPFCVMVRHAMKKQSLNIRTRDVRRDAAAKAELIAYGGKYQVPCLRIEHGPDKVEWMYESSDIKQFLQSRFGSTEAVQGSSAG